MLVHAGQRAIEHLEQAVDGIKFTNGPEAPKWKECEECIHSKLSKMISRRPQREPATRPFQQIGVDLIQLRKTGEGCYNGDKWLLHLVCQFLRYHLGRTIKEKKKGTLTQVVKALLARIRVQHNAMV
ncbi:uncharacterized protein EI97DRAFT_473075, partial [Westerdykella ornata]